MMNSYILSILTIAIASGILCSILSESNPLKKYVSYLCSLILVLTLLSPLNGLLNSSFNIKEYIDGFYHSIRTEEIIESSNSLVVSTSTKSVCNGIKSSIKEKFSFNDNDVFVYLDIDSEDITSIKIKEVSVVLTNEASWSDTDKVKEFLDELLNCKVNVTRR